MGISTASPRFTDSMLTLSERLRNVAATFGVMVLGAVIGGAAVYKYGDGLGALTVPGGRDQVAGDAGFPREAIKIAVQEEMRLALQELQASRLDGISKQLETLQLQLEALSTLQLKEGDQNALRQGLIAELIAQLHEDLDNFRGMTSLGNPFDTWPTDFNNFVELKLRSELRIRERTESEGEDERPDLGNSDSKGGGFRELTPPPGAHQGGKRQEPNSFLRRLPQATGEPLDGSKKR
jgi:hypothetical protein